MKNILKNIGRFSVSAGLLFFFLASVVFSAHAQTTGSANRPAAPNPLETLANPGNPAMTPGQTPAPKASSPEPVAGVKTSGASKNPIMPLPEKSRADTKAEGGALEEKIRAYRGPVTALPHPIVVEKLAETLEQRLERMITLDVREMNILDVVKFLALKGDFNMVTGGNQVVGRVTLYLKNVKIKDAMDIIVISNGLAYFIEKDIVYVTSENEYMSLFGKRFNDKNVVDIVQLKYAKPEYVLATLDSLKSSLGKVIIDEDTGSVVLIDTPESIAKMRKALLEIETPLEPFIYPLQYAKADVVAEKLKTRLDAHSVGTITVDERSNRLAVRALPERRKEIEKLIKSMDSPTKEVLVEVRVLQVTFKPQMDYGIDWQKDFRDSSNGILKKLSFKNLMMPETSLPTNLSSTYGRIGFGNFSVDDFQFAIRALKQVSDTRILSNPRLLVTNNEEAKIHVGDTVPYIVSTTSGTGDNAITSEDVRFVDVGVKISVTPTINDDGFVTMRLMPEISTVTATVESASQSGIPQVNKTMLESTVMVQDGMTIVLGGLKKENKVHSRKGIPVLMDLPYVKSLFSSSSESVEATEIVIFITPHVIKGDEDYRKFRGEIKPEQGYTKADRKVGATSALQLKK